MKAQAAQEHEDRHYWNRFRQGDESAFAWLYQRYVRVLYSYGLKIIRNADAVEDAIQDMFADLWRTRTQLAEAQSVRFYLFRSLRRRIHRSLQPDHSLTEPINDEYVTEPPDFATAETDIISAEIAALQTAQLRQWLTHLPARQLEALMLRYYQDFSYAEIAAIMNISEQGARNVVQKSLHTLRRFALTLALLTVGWLLKSFF